MQGTVASFDAHTRSGKVFLDDGTRLDFDAAAFDAGGLRLLRFGQRVNLAMRDGQITALTLSTFPLPENPEPGAPPPLAGESVDLDGSSVATRELPVPYGSSADTRELPASDATSAETRELPVPDATSAGTGRLAEQGGTSAGTGGPAEPGSTSAGTDRRAEPGSTSGGADRRAEPGGTSAGTGGFGDPDATATTEFPEVSEG